MTALRLLALLLLAPPLAAQSLLVVGGGREVPEATAWFVNQAAGPILVLDYEVDPDPGSVADLEAAGATVTYRPVTTRAEAGDPALAAQVRASGGVFLPGGNQARYVERWQGTALQSAIQDLYASGGAVGGTSAGAMVLGEVVFDARGGSFGSREALNDPAGAPIALTTGFLGLLGGVLVDTHFYERGRIGRLLAMVARHHAESGQWITGLGLDDATALTVGPDGIAEVQGHGTVTVVTPGARTTATVAPDRPLALSPVALTQVTAGFRFVPATGALVSAPPEATAFVPTPLASLAAPLWLDGSASGWTASGGSVDRFLASLPPEASVAVVSPSGDADGAATFDYVLGERPGSAWSHLDAPDAASEIAAADALVVVGLDREADGPRLAPGTASGEALHAAARPTLWLGSAAAIAGPQAVTGTESRADASLRGLLGMASGSGLLGGGLVMPLAWGADDTFWENNAAGLFWGLAQSGSGLGLLIPEGTTLEMSRTEAVARGETPVLLVDARAATLVATPEVRHNGALVGATVRVLPMDTAVDLSLPPTAAEPAAPLAPEAPRLAPNPSRGAGALLLTTDRPGDVTATAFDALGRRVASHTWTGLTAGAQRLDWTWPLALPAGVYTLRIAWPGAVDAVPVTLAR